jgi:hypothetical protein
MVPIDESSMRLRSPMGLLSGDPAEAGSKLLRVPISFRQHQAQSWPRPIVDAAESCVTSRSARARTPFPAVRRGSFQNEPLFQTQFSDLHQPAPLRIFALFPSRGPLPQLFGDLGAPLVVQADAWARCSRPLRRWGTGSAFPPLFEEGTGGMRGRARQAGMGAALAADADLELFVQSLEPLHDTRILEFGYR